MWIFALLLLTPAIVLGQASASFNYDVQTGTLGTTYSWIDCSSGSNIISGDDAQGIISWPFEFTFYDNLYTTGNHLSVCTNGFIRLDGTASTNYSSASSYNLSSGGTNLGQIVGMGIYDGKVGDNGGWVRSVVTGVAPNRIFTIEYNNYEIDYNDARYSDIQVSFYETSNIIVLKHGADNINKNGVDMGLHSGVSGYFNKWQEVLSGGNNSWVEYTPGEPSAPPAPASASWNYIFNTGSIGTTYNWIDCSSGNFVVSGDDQQATISWPFNFSYYDNLYTTSNSLSVSTNGFIRLDGEATTDYGTASNYNLTSTATNLGQIIGLAIYDGNVSAGSYVKSLVTGSAPNRIFTIEFNNYEIDYNDGLYANAQVSFYESINKIVLKLGNDNINKSGVDMGLHSGVNTYFNKWQEVLSGTNNSWIEYLPPFVEVVATAGTTSAYYFSLKLAFDRINDGTHQGDITIKINNSTNETGSAVLNANGSGSASYNSVLIYPTKTGLSINGDINGPLVDLDGADNVTIDGRVNAAGADRDLSIINTSNSSASGTSTIRFINDASDNTIQYCNLKSSTSRSTAGVLFFSSTTETEGNDNNTVEYNNITNAINANRPVNAIYSAGTTGKENSGNIIRNNNIYDFLKHASASRGIYLKENTTEWTIESNSFYETTDFTGTGTVTYEAIRIKNISGDGFFISNNYFGGSEPMCGGDAWTKTSATNNVFNAIYLEVGASNPSSVQNNTIQNFDWQNSGIGAWTGIYVFEGAVEIGTIEGNSIGTASGTSSIVVTGGTNGQPIYGLRLAGTGQINCSNNSIGAITGTTIGANATHIYPVHISGAPDAVVKNNTIGSTITAGSVVAQSASTSNVQKVYGIYSTSTGSSSIHNNVISNLVNNTSNTAVGTRGLISGIYLQSGENTVYENTICNLSIANANTSSWTPSISGIFINTDTEVQSIYRNLICDLTNTYSLFSGCMAGIYTRNDVGASVGLIDANFIHSLSVNATSSGASVYGIFENTDGISYSNNIINLGGDTDTKFYGIYDVGQAGKNVNFFFNTIYLSGTSPGSENSYALRFNTANNGRDCRDNIFCNTITGGTGNHYAIYYDNPGGSFTANYNDYYVNGTGGILGYHSGDQATLALLQTATSQDANSLDIDPDFAIPGGTNAEDYVSSASLPGVTIPGITTDYDGVIRNDPPKMGALEISPTFIWQGNTNTNFAIASNWTGGVVPPNGADIVFAATPTNDCYLDQDRSIHHITNPSGKKLVLDGYELTMTGSFNEATMDQIDATTASSAMIFAGNEQQSIPDGAYVSNTIGSLTLNNEYGIIQNGDLIIADDLVLTEGTFEIGSNTLTLNGDISAGSGSITGGNTSNVFIGGSGPGTELPGVILNDLTIDRAGGITLGGDLNVTGTLALTDGTLTIGPNTFTISGDAPTRVSGNIDASNTSATIVLNNAVNYTCPGNIFINSINNFTILGAGLSACCSCTINGVLDLQSQNPSATLGLLDMGTDTLTMGPNATTTGIGDVTGIVRRAHTFNPFSEYSFGSQYTTFTFIDGNTKPDWICVKISIGSVPGWTPWTPSPNGKIKRQYMVSSSDNASTSQANINMRYLLSELDPVYNNESKLVFWHKFMGGNPNEFGKAVQDFNNHFLGVVGLVFGSVSTTNLEDSQVAIAYSLLAKNVWQGDVAGFETQWEQPGNWSDGHVPLHSDDILIPGGLSFYPSLTSSSHAVARTIEIENGASITANSYDLTVTGSQGAWLNFGSFFPGTGTVIFNHGVSAEIVTVAGITNFYDVFIDANTTIEPVAGCVFRIAGSATGTPPTSRANWAVENSTVEWNGTNQLINNPVGLGGYSGYYNLILSGSGVKTMPGTALSIRGDFSVEGTASVTAASAIDIGGDMAISENAVFNTGSNNHTVGGDFEVNGTFGTSAGDLITLDGNVPQSILGSVSFAFEKLTINNAAGVEVFTDISVNDTFTLSDGVFDAGESELSINGGLSKVAGFLNVNPLSSLSLGGTSNLTIASDVFYTSPSIKNLTINRTGGVVIDSDLTVNGVLNLAGANPASGIIGALDMGTNTLLMTEGATTVGTGDVTGMVKRTSIMPDVEYTFGSQYTSVSFLDIGILPSEITVKTTIGAVPFWKADAVQRYFELVQVGASDTRAVIKGHYLDSELNGNVEENLIDLTYVIPLSTLIERGRSEINTTENWIALNNTNFGELPSAFGIMELGFGESDTDVITWDGSVSNDWDEPTNWTPAFSPDSTKIVVIPDATTTLNDPLLPVTDTINSLTIQSGGILNAGAGSVLTIYGSGGAWVNNGTFNASTSKVIFKHDDDTEIVTVAGETNFYDIEAGENTTMQPVAGCVLRISGTGMAYPSSVVDFSNIENTVEWNGANQFIVNPNGIAGNSGYYNLIISGSGTKTMPTNPMTVRGDLTISGTTSATAADSLLVAGDLTIGNGATFATGAHDHLIGGDFVNNGTFTPTAGGTMNFDGAEIQAITGSSAILFENLCITNLTGVNMLVDFGINNLLTLCNGKLIVGNNTLSINGTVQNPSGSIEVHNTSSLRFGGSSALTINNNLFNGNPTIANLIIDRTGGVTLGNEDVTVDNTLTLTSGTLSLGANKLSIAGNAPVIVSGNLDAGNSSAELSFDNSVPIVLPASLFSTPINDLSIIGSGGLTASDDFTVDGVLNLDNINPSAVKGILDMNGNTLSMGPSSTTIGEGDVSGIVKRTNITYNTAYSMGNEFTTVSFSNVGTLPTEMSLEITLGAAPGWRPAAVERVYDFIQTGGSGTDAVIQTHYLESELNGVDESNLSSFMHIYADPVSVEYGRSSYDLNDNWIAVSHFDVGVFSSAFGDNEIGIDAYILQNPTWTGNTSTSWFTASNWNPQGIPSAESEITIPDAATTANDPYLAPGATCKKITIESGGILHSLDDGELMVMGINDAWTNSGTFFPGTGTIVFGNGNELETVLLSGMNNFYNVIVTDKTRLQAAPGAIISIAGEFSVVTGNSVVDFISNPNTFIYSGDKPQTVIYPGSGFGYYHLSFTGDGNKILPAVNLEVLGDFNIDATASSAGSTISLIGTVPQNITGSVAAELDNLTINNASGVTLSRSALLTIAGNLAITDGNVFALSSSATTLNFYFPANAQVNVNDGSIFSINNGFYNGNGRLLFSGSGVLIVHGIIYDYNGNARITTPSGSMEFRSGINVLQLPPP